MSATQESIRMLFTLPAVTISPYYAFLYHLAETLGEGDVILVLGMYRATCCAHMAAASTAVVIGIDIDIHEDVEPLATKYRFNYICGDVVDANVVERVAEFISIAGGVLRLVFFDSSHTYSQVMGEFDTYRHFLQDGALLVFDDIHIEEDDVLRAVNEIPGEFIQLDHLHSAQGFGVKIYKGLYNG